MTRRLLIFSLLSCITLMVSAQINRMRTTTNNNTTTPSTIASTNVNATSMVKQVVTSYNGLLNISADINSKMQTEWQSSSSQFCGIHLKAELWSVVYRPDQNKPNYTQILLQQKLSALNISYQPVTGGISYSIGNAQAILPGNNDLAVIVFCDHLESTPLVIRGKPDDGIILNNVQNSLHHYESNAKIKLGQNIVYGIYSITPGKTDLNHLNFSFSVPGQVQNAGLVIDIIDDIGEVASKVINGVTYVFDQTVNGVTGLAKLFINNALAIDGFFINQAGQIFYELSGSLVNLIVYGNLPKERSLRQYEYDWANKEIFNGTLPDIGKIKVFNFMSPDNRRFYTWPSLGGSDIYMNIGDAFDEPMNYTNSYYPIQGQVLIHELSHAWQINKYGAGGMISKYVSGGATGQSYDPDCAHNSINSNFNIEQEATIVDRTFMQLYFEKKDNRSCTMFQRQWVEKNVRNGIPFDTTKLHAAVIMQQHAILNDIQPFLGDVRQSQAVYSKGNGTDGNGYYMTGSIPGSFLYYNNKDSTAFANWGQIRKKYEAIGAEFGILSWPKDDNRSTPKRPGAYQYFKGGAIYYSSATGAYYLSGAILTKWQALGYENGRLGFPKSDPITQTSNNVKLSTHPVTTTIQLFEGGQLFMQTMHTSIIGGAETSTVHVIYNNLLNAWNAQLGFPISDQASLPAKTVAGISHLAIPAFDSVATQTADIYLSSQFGGHAVTGGIRDAYRSLGGSNSALGLPKGDQISPTHSADVNKVLNNATDNYQEFQNGTIHYANGKIEVQYKPNAIQNVNNLRVH